tara:strand:- start:21963 stop:23015 length:1053 start_codon:yes stop_codon:yes gene_type:complete
MGLFDYFDKFIVDQAKPPEPRGVTNPGVVDRNLGDRSFLDFKFPRKSEGGPALSVKLPFFENIELIENKKARYQTYKPVSRSSDLYTYLGADSRKLTLTFFLTYHNIQATEGGVQDYINARTSESVEEIKQLFKRKSTPPPESPTHAFSDEYIDDVHDSAKQVLGNWKGFLTNEEYSYFTARYKLANEQPLGFPGAHSFLPGGAGSLLEKMFAGDPIKDKLHDGAIAKRADLIDMIVYWVNIVRSSVTNNAVDPTLGPPIVRLTHGVLYQNIPCICTGYDITADAKAPMDVETLLPFRIKVTMNLEEIRTGDFGQYRDGAGENEAGAISRDNLAGWESVIVHETMDPGKL